MIQGVVCNYRYSYLLNDNDVTAATDYSQVTLSNL